MQRRTKKRIAIVTAVIASVIALAALALHSLGLMFTEDLYYSDGSYADLLLTPRELSSLPLTGIVGEPQYYSSCGDRHKMPSNEITYLSTMAPELVVDELQAHFRNRGYSGDPLDRFSKGDRNLMFSAESETSTRTKVAVEIYHAP